MLDLGVTKSGSIGYHGYDSVSYYQVTTGSGIDYSLSLNNLTASGDYAYANIYIYTNAAFSSQLGSSSYVSTSSPCTSSLALAPSTTYYLAVKNDSPSTANASYSLTFSAAATPSPITLSSDGTLLSGTNSSSSSAVWYVATVEPNASYTLKVFDRQYSSTSYTAFTSVSAYKADRYTGYFLNYSGLYSGHAITVPSGESTLYICVSNCSGTYALSLTKN